MAYRSLPNAWSQDIPLVRPLLGVWREEILTYLENRGLQPALDESNLDRRYFRNRLRHELIPYLESYNPRLRQVLWRMIEVLREDHTILTKLEEAAWEICALEEGDDYICLNAQSLGKQSVGIQRRLMRRAINHLRPGLRDVDFEIVERGLGFLEAPARSGQRDLVAGLHLHLEGDLLWLRDREAELPEGHWPQLSSGGELGLEAPGAISFAGGWRLQAEIEDNLSAASQEIQKNSDPFQAWLDLERLQLPLRIRARQPGDRFQPLGMGGHSLKLSDFMINVKLPRRARDGWPLLLSGDVIAWVPGFQIGHPFRVTGDTKMTAHLQLKQQ
jgi:tRNA(Ile)-lysidine synthase